MVRRHLPSSAESGCTASTASRFGWALLAILLLMGCSLGAGLDLPSGRAGGGDDFAKGDGDSSTAGDGDGINLGEDGLGGVGAVPATGGGCSLGGMGGNPAGTALDCGVK